MKSFQRYDFDQFSNSVHSGGFTLATVRRIACYSNLLTYFERIELPGKDPQSK